MDFDLYTIRRNSISLAEDLEIYVNVYSSDGGRTIPHIKCVGNLRHYTTTRFFPRRRVESGSDPTTEESIERGLDAEPQDEALFVLRNIYAGLKRSVPEPKPQDEFL